MDIKEALINLLKIIYILFIIFFIYQLIKVILGGSWETENIMIAGLGIVLTGIFTIVGFLINQNKCIGKLEERTKNIGESLSGLGKDFKRHISESK